MQPSIRNAPGVVGLVVTDEVVTDGVEQKRHLVGYGSPQFVLFLPKMETGVPAIKKRSNMAISQYKMYCMNDFMFVS